MGREVYQIIHEALVNVRKHAKAREVEIRLEEQSGIAQVVISDDGCGFPEIPNRMAEGSGSAWPWSIQERAKALGGSLKVQSGTARGSQLMLEIPAPKPLAPRTGSK
jgi:signal transduction histidine kinase